MNIIFESKMNLPNLLTILRITTAPIIAILIWRETSHAQLIAAFLLFLIAGITFLELFIKESTM